MDLSAYVADFAAAMKRVDTLAPCALSTRDGRSYRPGIGPHTENQTVSLVMSDLSKQSALRCREKFALQVPYPVGRSKLDVAFGASPDWSLCIEMKMLRLMGDNGIANDNMLMHILSPYPQHRSAVTDTEKLLRSGLPGTKAIVIYAYEYPSFPAAPAIAAFEALAKQRVALEPVQAATASDLIHPVHNRATVYGWTISPPEQKAP